jgi:hypothetical protein
MPVLGSQVSVVHGFPSSQFFAVPTQTPLWHVSFSVHGLRSSHRVPSLFGAHMPVSWLHSKHSPHVGMQFPRQSSVPGGHSAQWPDESQNPEQHSALERQIASASRQFPWALQFGSCGGHTHSKVSVVQSPRQQSAFARQFSPMSRQSP